MRRCTILALALAAAVLPAGVRAADAPKTPPDRASERTPEKPPAENPDRWWNDAWSHRRTLTVESVFHGAKPRDVAVAEVPTRGLVRPDGNDLRVFGPDGKEVLAQVLACGLEDRALVAFAAPASGAYRLYFGNPKATAPRRADLRVGLVLESRARGPGDPVDWPAMQQILQKSPQVQGRWLRPTIALGYNPLGSWDNGIFNFTGWLECPADGAYVFATNSLDASFLLIDGRLVASWPGWHGPQGGEAGGHQGKVDLKKGLHRIDYVNAFRGHGACTVGWQKPGDPRIVPIPADAFAGHFVARFGPAETRDGPVPDFYWYFEDDLGYEGRPATSVQFRPFSRAKEARWAFGDGVTAAEEAPLHLYLEAGTYPVTMTLGGASVTQRVAVRPTRGHLGRRYEQRIEAYAKRIADYPTDGLSQAALLEMGQICHEARRFDGAIRAFRAAAARIKPGRERDPGESWYYRLFELYRDDGKFEDALWVCDRLLLTPYNEGHVARALYLKATVLYDDRDDAAGAEACLKEILTMGAAAKSDYVRLAFIRSGEMALVRGDREAARKILEDAETNPVWKRWSGDFEVSEGAHAINFEEYLRQKEYEAALKEVDSWEWRKPTEILDGMPRHLRGRTYLARGWHDRALREFGRALAAGPKSPFADEVLFLKGSALEGLKRPADARACYDSIVRQFPESKLGAMAKEKMEKMK